MMKNLLLNCLVACMAFQTQAQNWTWAETAGGILPDDANGCAIDSDGNMYASGFYFSSSINFGNGNSLSNNGLSDGFVVKYNSNGSTAWASKVKGPREDKATKCAVDINGNVIATGYFDSESIQFGGNNSDNVSNFDGSGNTFDAFIVKYNSSGTPQWYHAIGKEDDDGGSSVTTDASGNVYVTGWFRAPSMVVGGITVNNTDAAGGSSDMFIIKYAPNGTVLWAKNAGSMDDDKGRGCTVDPSGNVIVVGYCKDNPFTVNGVDYPTNGGKDAFVIKYAPNGTVVGVKVFGGSSGEEAFACSTDGDGNVFLSGNFSSNTVGFDAQTITNTGSGSGAFLAKLNPALNGLWARGASSNDSDEALGCATDMYGNTVITGVFMGSNITFGNTMLNNNGGKEIFLVKYDTNGNMFWAKKIGKSNDDGANDCAINNDGKIVISGYYNSGSLTLGDIDLDNSYFGIATSDVFVASTCNASIGSDTRTECAGFTWIDGNTYNSSNNTATYNFPAGGINTCDSMVVLNLTVNSVDVSTVSTPPNITANATGATFRWLDCNNNYAFINGETSEQFTASTNGSYAVEVTQNNCVDTSACVNITTVGVPDGQLKDVIELYPNPSSGTIQLSFGHAFFTGQISVFQTNGQLVSSQFVTAQQQFTLELPPQKGLHLVQITDSNGNISYYKVVRE